MNWKQSRYASRNWRSAKAAAYQLWYKGPEWSRLRKAHLTHNPLCVMCKPMRRMLATTVDHIQPHRGNRGLFLDPTNLQSLCEIHHGEKQRMEAGGKPKIAIGPDGWPLIERKNA